MPLLILQLCAALKHKAELKKKQRRCRRLASGKCMCAVRMTDSDVQQKLLSCEECLDWLVPLHILRSSSDLISKCNILIGPQNKKKYGRHATCRHSDWFEGAHLSHS
jgi:hypothetical protein